MMNHILKRNWPLILALIIGFCLRFIGLDTQNLDHDEVVSWLISNATNISELLSMAGNDNTPPLYHLLLRFWLEIIPDSSFGIRLLSALFGFGSIISLYILGKRVFDNEMASWASLLMSSSFYAVYFSQYARSTELFSLLSILTLYSWIPLYKGAFSRRENLLFIIFATLLSYTHYFSLFLLSSLALIQLFQIIRKKSIIKPLWSFLIVFIFYLPWAFKFVFPRIFKPESFWIEEISLSGISHILGFYFNSYLFGIISCFFFLYFIYTTFKNRDFQKKEGEIVLLSFLIIFFILVLIKSMFTTSVFLDRYFISFLGVGLLLFTAFVFKSLDRKWAKIIIFLISINALDNILFRRDFYEKRSELYDLASYVDSSKSKRVVLIVDNTLPGVLGYFKKQFGFKYIDHYINLNLDKSFNWNEFHQKIGFDTNTDYYFMSYKKENAGIVKNNLRLPYNLISEKSFKGLNTIILLNYSYRP